MHNNADKIRDLPNDLKKSKAYYQMNNKDKSRVELQVLIERRRT